MSRDEPSQFPQPNGRPEGADNAVQRAYDAGNLPPDPPEDDVAALRAQLEWAIEHYRLTDAKLMFVESQTVNLIGMAEAALGLRTFAWAIRNGVREAINENRSTRDAITHARQIATNLPQNPLDDDTCGLCGELGADKYAKPEHWPGERVPDGRFVHAACEDAECQRAHLALTNEQCQEYLRSIMKRG